MTKKEQEGFKEYAQRWRELAAQVQPPITEREMVTMFIDTLLSPYYNWVVGNVASTFADLVVVGERIKLGILRGKFAQVSNNTGFTKKPALEKKKGETNVVVVESVFPLANEAATTSLQFTPIQVFETKTLYPVWNAPVLGYWFPIHSERSILHGEHLHITGFETLIRLQVWAKQIHAVHGHKRHLGGALADPGSVKGKKEGSRGLN
ncbi:hypothetical protein CR513_46812, partial [Mucuna pruriens]